MFRKFLFLLLSVTFLILSGCNTIYRNYLDKKNYSSAEAERNREIRGSVNVILLPGCAEKPGDQDTLFGSLKLSQNINPESVKLPPNEHIYLGHVSEFILRTLKHYQLRESFSDFYGYRIILKFRKLTPQEMNSKKFDDYSQVAVGTAGMVAGLVTLMPLNAILFLVDGVKTEIDRQQFEDRALKMGLPQPKKSTISTKMEEGGRSLLYIKDEIGQKLTGNASNRLEFEKKISSYLIEECTMEKAAPEEIALYKEQVLRFKNLY